MHELSIAQRLVDRALDAAAEVEASHIEELTIEVGKATHLIPEQLEVCIAAVAVGTPAEPAAIAFERTEACGRCECGWNGQLPTVDEIGPAVPSLRCPDCAEPVELTAGRACRLREISVPDDHKSND